MIYRCFSRPAAVVGVSALLFFTACSDDAKPLPYPMSLKEEGIGKINADTPFDAVKVASMLPGFDVSPYTSFKEGRPYPILRVARNNHEIMIISPSKDAKRLGSLSIMTPAIPSPGGHHLGESYAAIFSATAPSCRSGDGEFEGKTLCQAPGSAHIYYLFPSSDQASGTQQPLPQSAVEEIVWMP